MTEKKGEKKENRGKITKFYVQVVNRSARYVNGMEYFPTGKPVKKKRGRNVVYDPENPPPPPPTRYYYPQPYYYPYPPQQPREKKRKKEGDLRDTFWKVVEAFGRMDLLGSEFKKKR